MNSKSQSGAAVATIILAVLLVLTAGGATYAQIRNREQIRNQQEEENQQREQEQTQLREQSSNMEGQENTAKGDEKFQLEGTVISIDSEQSLITVKITSSTDSIAPARGSEKTIVVADSARITIQSEKDPQLSQISVGAKVHIGGAIENKDKLIADKIVVQSANQSNTQETEQERNQNNRNSSND